MLGFIRSFSDFKFSKSSLLLHFLKNRPESDVYSQAASNLVAGSNLEETIQQILLMGGGIWDRDTVVRALRAAYNNPERAVDYLYSVSLFADVYIFSVLQLFLSLRILASFLLRFAFSWGMDFEPVIVLLLAIA